MDCPVHNSYTDNIVQRKHERKSPQKSLKELKPPVTTTSFLKINITWAGNGLLCSKCIYEQYMSTQITDPEEKFIAVEWGRRNSQIHRHLKTWS